MFKRLSHCPRCSTKADRVCPEIRQKVEELQKPMRPGEATPSDTDLETEEWYRYEPCGCVIPPEEHEELVG